MERWSQASYREHYRSVFSGKWEAHNPWEARTRAVTHEFAAVNTATAFRSFQGWLALTAQGPGDGGLEVVPMLREAISYILLRPFAAGESARSFPVRTAGPCRLLHLVTCITVGPAAGRRVLTPLPVPPRAAGR